MPAHIRTKLAGKLTGIINEERKRKKTIKRGKTQKVKEEIKYNDIDAELGFGKEEEEAQFVMPAAIRDKIIGNVSARKIAEQKY